MYSVKMPDIVRRIARLALSLSFGAIKTLQKVAWTACCWSIIIGITFVISSTSYLWFYSLYVPTALHEIPAYFTFSTCESGTGICSFPVANVSFSKDGITEVLSRGQAYKIILDLHMPESERNTELGLFMINIKVFERFGFIVQESARSVMLKYRSHLVTTLMRLLYFFPILAGLTEESQMLSVVLFDEYIEDPYHQALGAILELRSMRIDFYQAVLKVYAQFSGLSYLLYYWPIASAVVGVSSVFFCLMFVVVIGRFAYRGRGEEEEDAAWENDAQDRYQHLAQARERAHEQLMRERSTQLGHHVEREPELRDAGCGARAAAAAGDQEAEVESASGLPGLEEVQEELGVLMEELLEGQGEGDQGVRQRRVNQDPQ